MKRKNAQSPPKRLNYSSYLELTVEDKESKCLVGYLTLDQDPDCPWPGLHIFPLLTSPLQRLNQQPEQAVSNDHTVHRALSYGQIHTHIYSTPTQTIPFMMQVCQGIF